jgi:hypothetical protein
MISTFGDWRPSMPAITPSWSRTVSGLGLGEDRPDRRRHHLRAAFRHLSEDVAQEMRLMPMSA